MINSHLLSSTTTVKRFQAGQKLRIFVSPPESEGMAWYGILGFNVPLDTV